MGIFTIKLPDVGEGIAEAELVEWNVKLGDLVREDQAIAAVMTDKTTIEIPSEFTGKVVWLGGEIGQRLAIGCDLVRIDVDGREGDAVFSPEKQVVERPQWDASPAKQSPQKSPAKTSFTPVLARNIPNRPSGDRPLAAPSVRQRARTEGIELGYVRGSGPAGRISHEEVSAHSRGGSA